MFKKIIFVLFSVLFVGVFVNAQEDEFVTVTTQLDWSKINEATSNLNVIDVNFCEVPWEKEVDYFVKVDKEKKICLELINSSDDVVSMTIAFVDAVKTNDEWQNDACQIESNENLFPSYISWYDRQIELAAWEKKIIYPVIHLPKDVLTGMQACLVYYLKPTEMWGKINFSVLMRKAKFMNIHLIDSVEFRLVDYWWLFVGVILWVAFLSIVWIKKKK